MQFKCFCQPTDITPIIIIEGLSSDAGEWVIVTILTSLTLALDFRAWILGVYFKDSGLGTTASQGKPQTSLPGKVIIPNAG